MVKIIFLALGAGAAFMLYKEVTTSLKKFSAQVVGAGFPSLSGSMLTVPLKLRINNTLPGSVKLDRIIVDVSVFNSRAFIPVAQVVKSDLNLPAGSSDMVITPVVDLKRVAQNALDTLSLLVDSNQLQIQAVATVQHLGLSYTAPAFTETLKIS